MLWKVPGHVEPMHIHIYLEIPDISPSNFYLCVAIIFQVNELFLHLFVVQTHSVFLLW
jgi:ABC-type thiamine transport system ATPase subunit